MPVQKSNTILYLLLLSSILALSYFVMSINNNTDNDSEGFITDSRQRNVMMMDESYIPFNQFNLDNRDSHWIHHRNIMSPQNRAVKNLVGTKPIHLHEKHLINGYDLQHKPQYIYPSTHPSHGKVGKLEAKTIKQVQPHIYDNSTILQQSFKHDGHKEKNMHIVRYYDKKYYRDWRYPRQPIEIAFGMDPEGYCKINPHVYPCFHHLTKFK